jgi:hypothetical protein
MDSSLVREGAHGSGSNNRREFPAMDILGDEGDR